MTASILPTFTARMNYKQAQYTVGVIKTIENAENAYMAKNNSFADLTTLSSQGYLSSNFLQSVQGPSYPQPNWFNTQITNQSVNVCIDSGSGCPNNPGVGTNGYFIGIYNIPSQYQTYIEHELPGSGAVGTQDVSYVAPIPSSPPVATANYANSAGNANYANTAGYANSSGLPAWRQESNSYVGQWVNMNTNTTSNTLVVLYYYCTATTYNIFYNYPSRYILTSEAIVTPGGTMPRFFFWNSPTSDWEDSWCKLPSYMGLEYIISAYSG